MISGGRTELVNERLTGLAGLGMSYAIRNIAELAYDRTALTLLTEKTAPALASG